MGIELCDYRHQNIYILCGFKIGKNTFIGMKCYFDDSCVSKMEPAIM